MIKRKRKQRMERRKQPGYWDYSMMEPRWLTPEVSKEINDRIEAVFKEDAEKGDISED